MRGGSLVTDSISTASVRTRYDQEYTTPTTDVSVATSNDTSSR